MGQIQSVKVDRESLNKGIIPFNHVMVESDLTVEGKTTQGGIIYGHDENVTFETEGTSWEADIADVCGRVYKVPQKLYYNKEDTIGSMSWDCDMDLQEGDMVWFSPLESRNATALECEGKYYKLIPYADIVVARRHNHQTLMDANIFEFILGTYGVIMLNGFVLLEPVFIKNESTLAISPQGEVDKTRGIVRYAGKPNREYLRDEYSDFENLDVGDLVLLNPNTALRLLERTKYNAKFEGDKLFWTVQRRKIAMVISKGN